ncbi:Reticulon/nogo receptor [Operophtera brumata]|uniref:Reticulon/nogo receptor n=1 Tax=Operophtera brumata TaxID=104452 RepID=A0A0L7KPG1_OPEBR|nr:Reticulon/nogo receptor [Operophtera brumata]
MAFWKIITLACTTSILVDAKWLKHQKRDTNSSICDSVHDNTYPVQCFCNTDRESQVTRNADCYLSDASVSPEHNVWKAFRALKNAHKITFTNTRGIPLKYIPTNLMVEANSVLKFEIKYGIIDSIEPFAFGNASFVEEITLRDNKIKILSPYAFAHHKKLKVISLETNSLSEIDRNVFIDIPKLENLYLTNNEISTIHDKAFIYLGHLKELEIDRNKLFSLNFASFEGLDKLQTLDLSKNALEVIGDNTFEALKNLKSLNLGENKIQMLDDKAFNGLGKLLSLSLAHNNLTVIESDVLFLGLDSLLSLSLRGNQIKALKTTAIAPILSNFYGSHNNSFPCNCSLDWFMSLMNKALNKQLKITLENLKCVPDAALRESWAQNSTETAGVEKNNQVFEDEESQVQDYEYYDETQLNGKLFYLDVRDLLHCDNNTKKTDVDTKLQTKEATSTTTFKPSTHKGTIQGLLDVSLHNTSRTAVEVKTAMNKREKNGDEKEFTTTRLATVSAKPLDSKIYEDMASDEGRPDKIKADRNVQEMKHPKTNNANKSFGCVTLLVLMILFKLDGIIAVSF